MKASFPPGLLRRLGQQPGWALAVLTAIYTCGFIDRVIMQVLVEPIRGEFALSDTQIGLVSGLAFAVLNVALGLWVARLAERRRRIPLVWIGTLLWSAATAACGMAGSFLQLVLARIGVGVGEAVGLPATYSIASDLYPREKRTTAISVLLLAPPLGAFLGSVGGATIASAFDWRAAFYVAAAPGLLLALVLAFTVGEPQRGRFDSSSLSDDVPPLKTVVGRLWHRRSLRHMVLGSTTASIAGFGINAFLAAFLIRRFDFSVAEAGLTMGLIASLPASVSVVGAGWLTDRLARRSVRGYALVPAIALGIAAPLVMVAVTRDDPVVAVVLLTGASFLQYSYLGPTSGVVQNMMGPRMRASATAITSMITSLVSASIGPLLIGALSDRLAITLPFAGHSLGAAIAIVAGFYLWAAIHYAIASAYLSCELIVGSVGPL